MFGTIVTEVSTDDNGKIVPRFRRATDGYWGTPDAPKHRNVSGVLILPKPHLWNLREDRWQPIFVAGIRRAQQQRRRGSVSHRRMALSLLTYSVCPLCGRANRFGVTVSPGAFGDAAAQNPDEEPGLSEICAPLASTTGKRKGILPWAAPARSLRRNFGSRKAVGARDLPERVAAARRRSGRNSPSCHFAIYDPDAGSRTRTSLPGFAFSRRQGMLQPRRGS